jgi:hypothetical protein
MEKREKKDKIFRVKKCIGSWKCILARLVENCIVSIYLRPCKHGFLLPFVMNVMCSLKNRFDWDESFTPNEGNLITSLAEVGMNTSKILLTLVQLCQKLLNSPIPCAYFFPRI